MFDDLDEIRRNKYINNLDAVAEEFGLSGTYVEYEMGLDTEYSGIYFVCGTEHKRIDNGDFDIRDVINHNKRDRSFFNYGIMAFPLKDCGPFATHQHMLEHCRNAEFVQMVYNEYGHTPPPKISVANLTIMKMMYSNARNPEIGIEERAKYETSFKRCFELEDIYHNPQSPDYKKMRFRTDGYYDTGKSKVTNWFKRVFSRSNNRVTLEHLFGNSPSVEHMIINVQIVKAVKDELKKHPEILYWMSKPGGEVLKVPEGQGFGPSKEDNDTRTVDLAYSSFYKNEVAEILNRVCYPEAWITNAHELCAKYGDIYMVQIPETEYQNFFNLCRSNGIEFCMDADLSKEKVDELTMIVPYRDAKMVDAIMCRLCGETEDFHINLPQLPADKDMPVMLDCSAITDVGGHMMKQIDEKFRDKDYRVINSSFYENMDEDR